MSDRRARTLASSKTWARRSPRPSTASRPARPSRPARSLVVGRPGGGPFFVSFVRPSGPGSGPAPRARLVRRGLRQRRDRTTVRKKRRKPPGPVRRTVRPGGLTSFNSYSARPSLAMHIVGAEVAEPNEGTNETKKASAGPVLRSSVGDLSSFRSFIRTRATQVRASPGRTHPPAGWGQMRAERKNELNEVKAARRTGPGAFFVYFVPSYPTRPASVPPRPRPSAGRAPPPAA